MCFSKIIPRIAWREHSSNKELLIEMEIKGILLETERK